ncbi:peptidylprolyl isomerase [Paenibacillus glucanolyticus]|jgi:foldase protein PrsA|uniref:peptidylprolyl isomerase n=1 Tax=Paenibacillus TaxID=44249 RepID=UPI0003E2BF7A|nr:MULTISPECIES: peptidyl-prolyl cis-trans isomerase [Paenibacillus]ANA80245.1 peptidylprolyl isomerase [Paenibacillus glucanolyticus]AVV55686.1 peptidylprolyl isomerase [Paenibacillus glucanolyticus]ETT36274.1 PpiC-type peptidyl-prolyl cis-trans isomerase [Paenibacillus sp. FSL R5-808]
MTRQEKGLWATVIVLTACVIGMGGLMLFSGIFSKEASPPLKDGSLAVASIQDRAITEDEWVDELKKRYGRDMLMTMLNRQAVALEAKAKGIDITTAEVDAEIDVMSRSYGSKERFLSEMEDQLGITEAELRTETTYRLLLEKIATSDVHIEPQQIDAYLDLYPDQFRPKKQLNLSMIEVASEDEANQAMDRLENGEDFAALASEISLDEYTREEGGQIGLIEEDDPFLPPALLDAALELEPGDIAGPISLTDTYAIVYLHDIIEPKAPSEDKIREAVRKQLALEQSISLSELERQLREKYEARISAGTVTL